MTSEAFTVVYNKGLDLVSRREHSRHELMQKLNKRFPETLPIIANCNRILIINGHFQENLSVLPDKVTVQTLQQAYATNPEIFNKVLLSKT